jgi:hypothetical protein
MKEKMRFGPEPEEFGAYRPLEQGEVSERRHVVELNYEGRPVPYIPVRIYGSGQRSMNPNLLISRSGI